MKFAFKKTNIQLIESDVEVFLENGFLFEGESLCAIYANGSFDFICTVRHELDHIIATQNLTLKELKEERFCSQCESEMQEGFYFESDGTQYCSETCLTKVIPWKKYLQIYDDGNGDAYWTSWHDY